MGGKQKKRVKRLAYAVIVTLALAGGASEAKATVDSNSPQPYCGDPNHPYPVGDLGGPDGVPDCRVDFYDLVIFAAHWLEDNRPINSNSIVKDGIEYYIQTDKFVYNLGENVEMLYRVTNLSQDDVEFIFSYGPIDNTCDWMVDKDELRIWDNLVRDATGAFTSFNLSPSESYEYINTWGMTYNNGDTILPGNYLVIGELGSPFQSNQHVPVSVQIEIINRPPIADAGPDITAHVDGYGASCCVCLDILEVAHVVMDGSNSYDPDDDTLTFTWEAPIPWLLYGIGCYDDVVEAANPTGEFPVGSTTVTLTVSDGHLTDTDSLIVTVLP